MSRRVMRSSDDAGEEVLYERRKTRLVTLFNIQSGACVYCGDGMTLALGSTKTATLDHVIPRSRGGPTNEGNLVAACSLCNRSKGSLSVKEFQPSAGRAVRQILHRAQIWEPFLEAMQNPFFRTVVLSMACNLLQRMAVKAQRRVHAYELD
jgi:5-methylcytosine-specific restriction endonuclease McrA